MKSKKKSDALKKRKLTITDVVAAAHALGMEVSVSLKPQSTCQASPLLNVPSSQWPGDPTTRHIIAALNCTRRDIERGFKDNPTAKWIITPYAIIGREEFFTPVVTTTSTGTNQDEKVKPK